MWRSRPSDGSERALTLATARSALSIRQTADRLDSSEWLLLGVLNELTYKRLLFSALLWLIVKPIGVLFQPLQTCARLMVCHEVTDEGKEQNQDGGKRYDADDTNEKRHFFAPSPNSVRHDSRLRFHRSSARSTHLASASISASSLDDHHLLGDLLSSRRSTRPNIICLEEVHLTLKNSLEALIVVQAHIQRLDFSLLHCGSSFTKNSSKNFCSSPSAHFSASAHGLCVSRAS